MNATASSETLEESRTNVLRLTGSIS